MRTSIRTRKKKARRWGTFQSKILVWDGIRVIVRVGVRVRDRVRVRVMVKVKVAGGGVSQKMRQEAR